MWTGLATPFMSFVSVCSISIHQVYGPTKNAMFLSITFQKENISKKKMDMFHQPVFYSFPSHFTFVAHMALQLR